MTADPQHRLPPHRHQRSLVFEFDCGAPDKEHCAAAALELDAFVLQSVEAYINVDLTTDVEKKEGSNAAGTTN